MLPSLLLASYVIWGHFLSGRSQLSLSRQLFPHTSLANHNGLPFFSPRETHTHTHIHPQPSSPTHFALDHRSAWKLRWAWSDPPQSHLKQAFHLFSITISVSLRDLSHLGIILFTHSQTINSTSTRLDLPCSQGIPAPSPVSGHRGPPTAVSWINDLPRTILTENLITYRVIFSNQTPRSHADTDSEFLSLSFIRVSFIACGPWEGALGTGVNFYHKMIGSLR